MVELLRTNDLVFLSFVDALLKDAAIETVVLDAHASVMDGSVAAIPRRLMTRAEDADRARAVLAQADIGVDEPR